MIKGKRKNLDPDENLDSTLNANAGLPDWRVKVTRPRRRVAIAYYWTDNNGKELWAEWEVRKRLYRDAQGQMRYGSTITYCRQSEKPKGGFIANDGKRYSIERPSGEITSVNYTFTLAGKTINVPDDIVTAFREVWHINIDKGLTSQTYNKWKNDNLPQQQSG